MVAGVAVLLAVGLARGPDAHHGTAATAAVAHDLEVSADGIHWASHLDAPLFGTGVRWVPGDTRRAAFWVRGRGEGPASIIVGLAAPADGQPSGAGQVRLQARTGNGPWTPSAEPARLTLTGAEAASDRVGQRVEVRASVGSASENDVMEQPVDLAFEVTLLRSRRTVVSHEPRTFLDARLLVAGGSGLAVLLVVVLRRRRRGARDG